MLALARRSVVTDHVETLLKIGLGQLFIDLATALTGRFAGGPAKVSVVSSAMLGTISGSSIANTVTTGALTIPAMIKIGFKRHFAAAVEAASSTGGQITPPVGFNLFVLQGLTGHSIGRVARASIPFFFLILTGAAIVTFLPQIALWLPTVLFTSRAG